MKKDEAISILATSVRPREPKNRTRYDEAVKMAIEALRQPEQRSSSQSHENDLISRQAAVDAIFGRSHEIIKMRIGNLPSAQPEQRWIPFRERSPKEGQQILACSEDGVMWMTAYNSQSRFSGAWMQLPEPYREDGEAE